MNILFVNSISPGIWGGMEEWIRLVASGMTARGHQCYVCGRPKSRFLAAIEKQHPEIERFPVDIRFDFSPLSIFQVRRIIQASKIDLVVANFTKDLRISGIAAKLSRKVPVVWSLGSNLAGSGVLHRWLTPRLTSHILVPSMALATEIGTHAYLSDSQIQIVPIGLPDYVTDNNTASRQQVRNRFGISDDAIVAVTSGRYVEQKGHDLLLKAFYHIAATHPNLVLLWLGDGPMRQPLEQEISRFGLSQRIILAGMCDNVSEILPACDLMIHPSRVEPYGIAILEGMRAGLPIIATNVGGIPEVTGGAAFALVQPEEDLALSHAIGSLAANSNVRRTCGERARTRYLDTLTFDRMITNLNHYFSEVAGAR